MRVSRDKCESPLEAVGPAVRRPVVSWGGFPAEGITDASWLAIGTTHIEMSSERELPHDLSEPSLVQLVHR